MGNPGNWWAILNFLVISRLAATEDHFLLLLEWFSASETGLGTLSKNRLALKRFWARKEYFEMHLLTNVGINITEELRLPSAFQTHTIMAKMLPPTTSSPSLPVYHLERVLLTINHHCRRRRRRWWWYRGRRNYWEIVPRTLQPPQPPRSSWGWCW